MASKMVRCKACAAEFRIEYLKRCPNCRAKINSWDFTKAVDVLEYQEDPAPASSKGGGQSRPVITPPVRSTLTAEERTTHAVRSIAIFILIQVTSSVIATIFAVIGFLTLSSPDGEGGAIAFFIMAGIVAIYGLISSITRAWSEYSLSSQ